MLWPRSRELSIGSRSKPSPRAVARKAATLGLMSCFSRKKSVVRNRSGLPGRLSGLTGRHAIFPRALEQPGQLRGGRSRKIGVRSRACAMAGARSGRFGPEAVREKVKLGYKPGIMMDGLEEPLDIGACPSVLSPES